jgi:hypothetical protein
MLTQTVAVTVVDMCVAFMCQLSVRIARNGNPAVVLPSFPSLWVLGTTEKHTTSRERNGK